MPMLAEQRRKTKWVIQPRNKPIWTKESAGIKLGKQLMEKMGWSAGKGLGAQEQGMQEPLHVSYKNDRKGIGSSKSNDEDWLEHQEEFDSLLSQLMNNCEDSTGKASQVEKKEIKSLEEMSRQSRVRVHYQKFTKGKDLSRYSEHDLACILGISKNKKEKNIAEEEEKSKKEAKEESHYETSFGVTTINSGSISDYFKNKKTLDQLKKTKLKNSDVVNETNCDNSPEQESCFQNGEENKMETDDTEVKSRKKKNSGNKSPECFEEEIIETFDELEESCCEKPEKEIKKHKKSKKRNKEEIDFESEVPKPKKIKNKNSEDRVCSDETEATEFSKEDQVQQDRAQHSDTVDENKASNQSNKAEAIEVDECEKRSSKKRKKEKKKDNERGKEEIEEDLEEVEKEKTIKRRKVKKEIENSDTSEAVTECTSSKIGEMKKEISEDNSTNEAAVIESELTEVTGSIEPTVMNDIEAVTLKEKSKKSKKKKKEREDQTEPEVVLDSKSTEIGEIVETNLGEDGSEAISVKTKSKKSKKKRKDGKELENTEIDNEEHATVPETVNEHKVRETELETALGSTDLLEPNSAEVTEAISVKTKSKKSKKKRKDAIELENAEIDNEEHPSISETTNEAELETTLGSTQLLEPNSAEVTEAISVKTKSKKSKKKRKDEELENAETDNKEHTCAPETVKEHKLREKKSKRSKDVTEENENSKEVESAESKQISESNTTEGASEGVGSKTKSKKSKKSKKERVDEREMEDAAVDSGTSSEKGKENKNKAKRGAEEAEDEKSTEIEVTESGVGERSAENDSLGGKTKKKKGKDGVSGEEGNDASLKGSERSKVEGEKSTKLEKVKEENVIHSHKLEFFKNKKSQELLFKKNPNDSVFKKFFGAEIEKFKGSNLGNLQGYGIIGKADTIKR